MAAACRREQQRGIEPRRESVERVDNAGAQRHPPPLPARFRARLERALRVNPLDRGDGRGPVNVRAAIEQAQWQAPTLTIAAQAFLLSVLTDSDVSTTARLFILGAGVLACVAAVLALVRLRAREVQYSEAVSDACEKARLPDPRPFEPFPRKQAPDIHRPGRVDRAVRAIGASKRLPTVYLFWIATLLAFIAADVVALFCTT